MAGTWVEKVCDCDICRRAGVVEIARFDAANRSGQWGNFCLHHWTVSCRRALGVGVGQMLVRPGEDPRTIAVDLKVDDLVVVGKTRMVVVDQRRTP